MDHGISPGIRRVMMMAVALVAVVVALFAFSASAQAATLVVDPVIGCGDSPDVAPFCTIQAAIDAAADGDTINIYPGSYNETAAGRTVLVGTPQAQGPHQFGLFIAKDGLTLQGVKADGSPVTNAADVVADITTNSTANYGPDGVWVEANNVTIAGLKLLDNDIDNNLTTDDNNKTIEVVGNNFTFKDSVIDVSVGGSLYFNDWLYVAGPPAQCAVNSYTVTGNRFLLGATLDIASGAGGCGTGTRLIQDNVFETTPEQYWPQISFNSSGTSIGWFVFPVGPATITGNSFQFTEQYIRWRGVEPSLDWGAVWGSNSFPHAVQVGPNPPTVVRSYSYDNAAYAPHPTFPNVQRIASVLWPDQFVAGDSVLVAPNSQAVFYVDPLVKKQDSGDFTFDLDVKYQDPASKDYTATDFVIDYEEACLQLNSVDGYPSGFSSFPFEGDDGLLEVGVWDETQPLNGFASGTFMTLHFTVKDLPGCRADGTFGVLIAGGADAPTCTPINGDVAVEEACIVVGANVPVDFNAAPTAIALSPNTIAENLAAHTVVGALTASDSDGNPATFAESEACTGSFDNSKFEVVNGEVRTELAFDYETMPHSFGYCVAADDGRGGVFAQIVTINVTNTNELPVFVAPFEASIAENVTEYESIVNWADDGKIIDPDGAGTPAVWLVDTGCAGGPFDNALFGFDDDNLDNRPQTQPDVITVFNYEDPSNPDHAYQVCVKAFEGAPDGPGTYAVWTVRITDVNEAPTDITISGTEFVEPLAAGVVFATFTTTGDPDAGATHTYSLVAGAGANHNTLFTIDGNGIKPNAQLNSDVYKIRVRSTDNGGLYTEKPFEINVFDTATLDLLGEEETLGVPGPKTVSYPYVAREGKTMAGVEVVYTANGNAATSLVFTIADTSACVGAFTIGWTASGVTSALAGNQVTLSGAPLPSGALVKLTFPTASCPGLRNDVALDLEKVSYKKGALDLAISTDDGQIVTIEDSPRGDCNANTKVNSGDYVATVLETFGTNSLADPYNFWLDTSRFGHVGSPYGCDSDQNAYIGLPDVLCTVKLSFGKSCTSEGLIAPASVQPAVMTLAGSGSATLDLSFAAGGNAVGAASTVIVLPEGAAFDPTDANGDEVPDAIRFNTSASILPVAIYEAESRSIKLAVTGISLPLPVIEGPIATITLQSAAGGVRLTEASAADAEGRTVVTLTQVGEEPVNSFRSFLPSVSSY